MIVIDPMTGISNSNFTRQADCVDRDDPAQPARGIATGDSNDLMLLRVCTLFDPWFPHMGLGKQIPHMNGGAYAHVSISAFVMEPE